MQIDMSDRLLLSSSHGLNIYILSTVRNGALFAENAELVFSSWVSKDILCALQCCTSLLYGGKVEG